MGTQSILSQDHQVLILVKQTMDTAADTRRPAMERKAGQKEEASWEDRNKGAKTALAEAK
jgi:hypothetical protein